MGYTYEEKAIAIAPKFTSILSMMGSGFIAVSVWQQKKLSPFNRLLLMMSICDVVVSSWFFLGTWPVPSFEDVYWAVGNYPVCIAQGYWSQFSIAVAFYNASLTCYYLAVIKYGWSDHDFKLRLEPILHAVPLAIGFGTATMGLSLRLYNNDYWECWISPFPTDCDEAWRNDGVTNCIRGNNASLYRWLFYYMLLWMAIAIVTYNMIVVYYSVVAQEKACESLVLENEDDQNKERRRKHSREVAKQGYWFCGAFYLTWIFPSVARLVQVVNGDAPFPLILVTAMMVPFQGFFNFLVYIMPRYKGMLRRLRNDIWRLNSTEALEQAQIPNEQDAGMKDE